MSQSTKHVAVDIRRAYCSRCDRNVRAWVSDDGELRVVKDERVPVAGLLERGERCRDPMCPLFVHVADDPTRRR